VNRRPSTPRVVADVDQRSRRSRQESPYWLVSDCERQRLSLAETAMLHEQRMPRVAVCEEGRGVRVALVEIVQQLASLNASIEALTRRSGGDA
jgi:hypothetical protein